MPDLNNNNSPSPLTYTVAQIAEKLGISIRKAYNMCERSDNFKVFHLGKRCLRIHKESFDKWFDS